MGKHSRGKTYDEVRRDLQAIREVLANNSDLARKYEDRVEKHEKDIERENLNRPGKQN